MDVHAQHSKATIAVGNELCQFEKRVTSAKIKKSADQATTTNCKHNNKNKKKAIQFLDLERHLF